MICKNCEKEIELNSKYCIYCGEPTNENDRKEDDDERGILENIGNFIGKIFG